MRIIKAMRELVRHTVQGVVRRLFCLHLNWHEAVFPRRWPAWYQTEWECDMCGKRIVRDDDDPPIQFISANAAGQGRREATYPEPACSQGGCQ